jgi:hypothetical protein
MDQLEKEIYSKLNCKHEITKEYIKVLIESIKRFEQKQEVYDISNIADSGEIGIFTRIGDFFSKIKKYLSISEDKREELMLTDEKVDKYFFDIAIFAFIGYILRKGNWK